MGVLEIVAQIDRQLIQLEKARDLLRRTDSSTAPRQKAKKSRLSPEGRKRIAEAAKRRWAKQRKASL